MFIRVYDFNLPHKIKDTSFLFIEEGSKQNKIFVLKKTDLSATNNRVVLGTTELEFEELTIDLPDDVTINHDLTVGNDATITNDLTVSNNATITGNLTVNGTTTTINTETLTIEDPLIKLAKNNN